ncbi:succinate dehydrogenase, hydrophobic membrane anchor protein [Hydrogenovibrio marinus]|uniref:succinate dehydrogenase, hydrophobic membrane anchor protein n=1 Tax=Hydrogenovibrio marinus TaxID=28885 RepID=UPI0009DCAD1D|nr:succinate dehydrogenase, hydrophobic membrane anchor protein [Hydrogenovibrio marinus]BBN60609.1 hypothetical protein HVMH_2203 [Hydrogenovibrio marinus]
MMMLSGAKAHLWQRVSAVYLFFYFPFAIAYLSQFHFETYQVLQSALTNPYFTLPTFLGLAMVMVHIWIGVRDVVIDYLPRKLVMMKLVGFGIFWLAVMLDLIYLAMTLIGR